MASYKRLRARAQRRAEKHKPPPKQQRKARKHYRAWTRGLRGNSDQLTL